MSDPIITRQISPYVSEQGPASEINRDRAQVAALGASNVQKPHNAPSGDLISREAVARQVYAAMVYANRLDAAPENAAAWVEGGNSFVQQEARATADRILRALKEPRA